MDDTREQQLLKAYLQAKEEGDLERVDSIIAVAVTNPVLDELIWQAELVAAADEREQVTPEDVQRAKDIIAQARHSDPRA